MLGVLGVCGIDEQERAAGEGGNVRRLVGSEPRVQGREDRAELGEGDEERQHVEVRVRPGDHSITVADTELSECPRQPISGSVELRVGEDGSSERGRNAVRNDCRVAPEDVSDEERMDGIRSGH